MKQYNLVIQGPIVSTGLTGKTYINKGKVDYQSLIVNYNCIENIQKTLRNYGHLFKQVIIATWENAPIEESDIAFCENCKLIKIKDNTRIYKSNFYTTPSGQVNLIRQFLSTKEGILALDDAKEDDYIIKMRTDQHINLDMLLQLHQANSEEDRADKIYVSCIDKHRLSDFYFVAQKDLLTRFCDAVFKTVNYPQLNIENQSVHVIMGLALYLDEATEVGDIPNVVFLKQHEESIAIKGKKIPNTALMSDYVQWKKKRFSALSIDLYRELLWRGDQLVLLPCHTDYFVWDESKKVGPALNAYNIFLYCSPKRYFKNDGKKDIRAILGALNWLLMTIFPFYGKHIISNIERYSNE